jgi:3',5'-cyclic AMP phosphodiesterase CpdA
MAILHLSDPHFGTERAEVCAALLAWAATPAAQAVRIIVVSGDITQRARPGQFARAKAFLLALQSHWPGAPLLILPGNHDIPLFNVGERILRPFGAYQRVFGEYLESHFAGYGFDVQTVNTVRRWRHTRGWVSEGQIQRVAARLRQAARNDVRVVVTHQPIAVLRAEDEADRLEGGEAALSVWSRAGADIILGGHIHLPYVSAVTERGEALLPNAAPLAVPHVWLAQAGTALSARVRHEAGNSFNLVRRVPRDPFAAPQVCELERWDFKENNGAFARHSVTVLPLPRSA